MIAAFEPLRAAITTWPLAAAALLMLLAAVAPWLMSHIPRPGWSWRPWVTSLLYWCLLMAAYMQGWLLHLLLASVLMAAAWWLARYWARSVLIWAANEAFPFPWRWAAAVRVATMAAGVALASEATGFATTLIRGAFLILLAGVTFAVAQAARPIAAAHLAAFWSGRRGEIAGEAEDPLLR